MAEPVKYEDVIRKGGICASAFLCGTQPAVAANYGPFFIAPRPLEVLTVCVSHVISATDAGAVTLNVEILEPGEAPDSGFSLLKTAYSLKGTINTPVTYSGYQLNGPRTLNAGDRIGLVDAGVLTDLRGLAVTVYFAFANKGDFY